MYTKQINKIKNAIEFTKVYNKYSYDKSIREAKCVDLQLRHIVLPIDENDVIAGAIDHGYVGFSSQYGGVYTYFYNEFEYLTALNTCQDFLDEETLKEAEFINEFWKLENTAKKLSNEFIRKYGFEMPRSYINYGFANCDARVAGTNLDFQTLMDLGLTGLEKKINGYEEKNG